MSLRAYAALTVPAVLTGLFAWPWWLGVVLLMPGVVLLIRFGWIAADALGIVSRDETGQWIVGLIAGPGAVAVGALAKSYHKDYAALLFVGYLVIIVDPLWRFIWSRYRLRLQSSTIIGEASGSFVKFVGYASRTLPV
jgi:hypothetical protein